jgi:hypothetical protein
VAPGKLRRRLQGPDGALLALAGQVRAQAGRGAAHRADLMRREESGVDRSAATGPWRDQGGGVPGGAAAKGIAGGQTARGHTAGERAKGRAMCAWGAAGR